MQKNKYYDQAVQCVKETVLPIQRELYEKSGRNFDVLYTEYMNNDMYFGKVIEPGHIYELGYHRCSCGKVTKATLPEHCECTRQSILYILQEVVPQKKVSVEILETILCGSKQCRFKITIE